MKNSRPIADRFWERVDKTGDCWLWTGSLNATGYGTIGKGGRGNGIYLAHRVSFELHHGPIPDGLFVIHSCDNPPCVNPAHLRAGTSRDNMQDAISRGRWTSPMAKRTHCPQGHPYDEGNTRVYGGRRHCRTCSRERQRRLRASARHAPPHVSGERARRSDR